MNENQGLKPETKTRVSRRRQFKRHEVSPRYTRPKPQTREPMPPARASCCELGPSPQSRVVRLDKPSHISLHYAPQDLGQLSAWPRPEPNPEFRFLQSGNPLTPLSLPSQTRKLPLIIRFPNRSAAENAASRSYKRLARARARQTNYYGRRRP